MSEKGGPSDGKGNPQKFRLSVQSGVVSDVEGRTQSAPGWEGSAALG